MTFAPYPFATAAVRSVEPLSTTMSSSTNSGMRFMTPSMPCSSLRHGMMTVIDCCLYIRARRNHQNSQFASQESPGLQVCVKTPALTAPGGRGSPYLDESPRPEAEPRLSGAVEADFSHHPLRQGL